MPPSLVSIKDGLGTQRSWLPSKMHLNLIQERSSILAQRLALSAVPMNGKALNSWETLKLIILDYWAEATKCRIETTESNYMLMKPYVVFGQQVKQTTGLSSNAQQELDLSILRLFKKEMANH